MKLSKNLAVALSWFILTGAGIAETRSWTDDQGRKVEAELVSVEGDSVLLRLANGQEVPFPLAKLSPEDQEFVAGMAEESSESGEASADHEFPDEAPDPEDLPEPEPWPTSVSVGTSIDVEEVEDAPEGSFVYRTEHFEFHCDAQLGTNVMKEFARLFEVVYAAVDQSPLPLLNRNVEGLRVVRLFETSDDYMKAGGLPGSSGVFIGRSKEVLVPLDSLGLKKVGSRYSIESRDENQTLIHEIVHQLTWHWPMGSWWSEGLAEFYASAEYSPGRLKFATHGDSLREYMKERKGVWEEDYTAVHPENLFRITNAQWNSMLGGKGGDGVRNYASSAMLYYYFCQMDADKDGAPMLAFMQGIKLGMSAEEAVEAYLLRGRTMDELAEELAKSWRRHSLDLSFDKILPEATSDE